LHVKPSTKKTDKKTQVSLKCSDPNFSAKANEFPKDALQASGPFYQDPLVTPILETRLRSAAVALGLPPTSAWSCEDLAHHCSRQGRENEMLAIENSPMRDTQRIHGSMMVKLPSLDGEWYG